MDDDQPPDRRRRGSILPIVFAGLLALAIGFLALPSCMPVRDHPVPRVTPGMIAYAARAWPDSDERELTRGRDVIFAHCQRCHARPGPDIETIEAWPAVVHKMAHKASLSEADRTAVLRYLISGRAVLMP